MIGAATLLIVGLAVLIAFGVQIAVALGVVSVLGIYAATGDWHIVSRLIAAAAYDGVSGGAFIAIPLIMLMGEFIARSGAVTDVFRAVHRASRLLPGGAGLAGMIGNALYAFVAGASAAGAAGFSRLSYPELRRRGYDRAFALATLASSSALGMLLPPGVLMVAWGILTGQSIGAIFLAAIVPALVIAVLFAANLFAVAARRPHLAGAGRRLSTVGAAHIGLFDGKAHPLPPHAWASVLGMVLLFVAVLGGIGSRLLSPVEAVSVGAAIGLVMALRKGMRLGAIVEAILVVGRASAPVLLLLFTALLYAQALTVTGAGAAADAVLTAQGSAFGLAIMIATWLVLASLLDPLAVMTLTVAPFSTAAVRLGIDPLAFAVIGIIALEAAQLMPPLGLLVFAVKAAVDEDGVAVVDVFRAVLPFLAILLAVILLLAALPEIAIWLPRIAA